MPDMSNIGDKIRLIREKEGMNRKELSELLGISYGTLTNYETRGVLTTETFLLKFTNHPRFHKYALWLMTGQTAESEGQIAPYYAPAEQRQLSMADKIRLMREAEGLSRKQMGDLTGVSPNNLKNYEILGRQIPAETLVSILNIEIFRKYSDWLMFNTTNAAAGQIAPPLSLDGSDHSEADQVSIETTQKSHR